MAFQSTTNYDTSSLILSGTDRKIGNATIVTDAGRTVDLLENTIMGFIPSTGKWTPFIGANLATTVNVGVYVGETIPAATIAAGDVTGALILVGSDILVREDMLVIDEDTTTLDTAVGTGDTATTARYILSRAGIYAQNSNTLFA